MKNNPSHLFVYVGHSTQTKNKLQSEFGDYLKSLSGKVVKYEQRGDLIAQIISQSKVLNEKHKRCAPLNIGFSNIHTKQGMMITGFYFLIFQILFGYEDN